MLYQKIQKRGGDYIITIPAEEVERQQLTEGQWVSVEVRPAQLDDDVMQAFEASWEHNQTGYRYLTGR